MERGEGERLHAQRRKRFWQIVGGLALAGAVGGFVSGFVMGYADAGGMELPGWASTAAAAALILTAILAAYGSWRFFVSVDELEVADNLWASLIGFYAYGLLFPTWWLLHRMGEAPEPHDWIIFGVALGTSTLAYLVRKWRTR